MRNNLQSNAGEGPKFWIMGARRSKLQSTSALERFFRNPTFAIFPLAARLYTTLTFSQAFTTAWTLESRGSSSSPMARSKIKEVSSPLQRLTKCFSLSSTQVEIVSNNCSGVEHPMLAWNFPLPRLILHFLHTAYRGGGSKSEEKRGTRSQR